MCGIFGVLGDADPRLLDEMAAILRHRGPNGSGKHVDGGMLLGHVRLSIIDLETGAQPMSNEEGTLTISYNGEVYNFRELRAELEKLGHRFRTRSDTEVVLQGYEAWGTAVFERLNGFFALAIWDSARRELVLARDRHGIKPLYTARSAEGHLVFASEAKAILLHPGVRRELDREAFHLFLNLRYLPREKTMFRGVSKMAAGTWMRVGSEGTVSGGFGALPTEPLPADEDAIVAALRVHLEEAVRASMVSDVPVGLHLSGGIDSSGLVAIASELSDEPVKTFCMGFGDEDDEIAAANRVAEHFGTDHRDLVVKTSLFTEYPRMIWHADAPKRNLYPFFLSELTSKRVKVALTGLGADELFGGYPWKYVYADGVERARAQVPGAEMARFRASAETLLEYQSAYGAMAEDHHQEYLKKILHLRSDVDLYLEIQSMDDVFTPAQQAALYGPAMAGAQRPVREWYQDLFPRQGAFLDGVLRADYRVKMQDDFLFVDDAMAMAHSVENRPPYLSNGLVDFAFRVPPRLHWRDGRGKYVLRKALGPKVPKWVLDQPKKGFGTSPFRQYRDRLHEIARQKLEDAACVREGLIQKSYLDRVLTHPVSERLEKHYMVVWNLLAFEVWHDLFMTGRDIRRPRFRMD